MAYSSTEGGQGICPNGWHIPRLDELNTLNNAVGGDSKILSTNASNYSGFSLLFSGYCEKDGGGNGNFAHFGDWAAFWSSSIDLSNNSGLFLSVINYYNISNQYWPETTGINIRCLKN